jgi:hypothetical protein
MMRLVKRKEIKSGTFRELQGVLRILCFAAVHIIINFRGIAMSSATAFSHLFAGLDHAEAYAKYR